MAKNAKKTGKVSKEAKKDKLTVEQMNSIAETKSACFWPSEVFWNELNKCNDPESVFALAKAVKNDYEFELQKAQKVYAKAVFKAENASDDFEKEFWNGAAAKAEKLLKSLERPEKEEDFFWVDKMTEWCQFRVNKLLGEEE